MNTERLIGTRGRITISMRQQGGVFEAILRVAGVDVIGGLSVTPIGAIQDMMREMRRVMRNDSEWLSKWPRPDVMPVQPIAVVTIAPMKPMRLGEVGDQLNRDAESYKRKRRHSTAARPAKDNYGRSDLQMRQRIMAEKRHPNRRVVAGVRAAGHAASN